MAWLEGLNVFSSSWNLKHGTNHCWKHCARMTIVGILVMGQSVTRKHLLCLSCGLVLITLCLIKYWYFPFSYFDLYQISWLVSWEPKGNSALQAFWQVINYVVTPFSLALLRILDQTYVLTGTVDDSAKDGGCNCNSSLPSARFVVCYFSNAKIHSAFLQRGFPD